MTNSSPYTVRCVDNNRLVYYLGSATASFWDNHWQPEKLSLNSYRKAMHGNLSWYEEPFTRFLPRDLPILEAGCGNGHIVVALNARGYQIEGVEWAEDTVEKVKSLFPQLNIRKGDVLQLDVPNEYYGAYISLGVVEHREHGPGPFLQEAYRVLVPNGIACFSVPYFHCLRKLKSLLGQYEKNPGSLEFYQYAFSIKEFVKLLAEYNFDVVDLVPYDSSKGIADELPLLYKIYKIRGLGWRLKSFIRSSKLMQKYFGHMVLFVCLKRPMFQNDN